MTEAPRAEDAGGAAAFWEDPDVVRRFAERDPDRRLADLVERAGEAGGRALDLGCAGGRNTVFLARRGWDVRAIDASRAMVEETRRRLAEVLGPDEARARVRVGRMDDLDAYGEGAFDLVVALGIYQGAQDMEEWHRAVAGTARVLRPGGRCLVAHFTPEVDLTGEGVRPVPGERHVFTGLPGGGRSVLLGAEDLDAGFAGHGLVPEAPTEVVAVERDQGRRVTANALYRREGPAAAGGR